MIYLGLILLSTLIVSHCIQLCQKEIEMNRIYCENCRHLDFNGYSEETKYAVCKSPENIKLKHTWKNIIYLYPLSPQKLNKNNNCKSYVEKENMYNLPRSKYEYWQMNYQYTWWCDLSWSDFNENYTWCPNCMSYHKILKGN
jgi:hypothetical protein